MKLKTKMIRNNPYKGTTIKTAKIISNKANKEVIKISFPFDHKDLKNVRTLDGREYHPNHKYWTCPISLDNIENLHSFGFLLDDKLKELLKKKQSEKIRHCNLPEIEIPGLKKQLFNFQNKAVAFIEAKKGKALIGDEMGLGKTAEALAWLQLHPELRPAVIVVPASLKLNWYREIEMWMGNLNVCIAYGTDVSMKRNYLLTDERFPFGEILIINYDIVPHWVDLILKTNPKVLIADECHYFKNDKAKRTKAIMQLGKSIPNIIALSGTPIVNKPAEIYNAIKLIDPLLFPSRWGFLRKYCGAYYNGYGWDFNGATNTKELNDKLTNSIMIRRKKEDVLNELPDKLRSFIPIELSNKKEYEKAEDDFIQWVKENRGIHSAKKASNAAALTEIEILKQVAVQGKLKQTINWINDFLECGEKLVIFAVHHFVIDLLMKEFNNLAVKIDGSVTGPNRQKAVDSFQNNPKIRLFVGNIKAAGVGITLTAASKVIILELPWTPGELEQAIDRVHRIGQKDNVIAYFLLALDTIEERLAKLLDKKRKVLDAVLDGKDTEQESLLTQLINEYK